MAAGGQSFWRRLESPDQAAEEEEDNRPHGGDADRAEIELTSRDLSPPEKSRSQPPADERSNDPQRDRDDTARRVPPWHQKFGQTPRH